MFKQFISQIDGAGLSMSVSVIIFLGFFLAVGLWMIVADKEYLDRQSRMPLNDSSTNQDA